VSEGKKEARFLELYRRMRLIRRFGEEIRSPGGQEVVPVAVCEALGAGDRVAATSRGHGHALALGVDPTALLAELLGRATGVCGGRAGWSVIDLEHRLIGCFESAGGSIAAATGVALALQRAGGVAVAFFDDDAVNHGNFHECLNLAKVRELPVIYVCESNRYGELAASEQLTAGEITGRPQALGIPSITIDADDVWTVRKTAAEAVERVRAGMGPHFVEALRAEPRDPLTVVRAGLAERYGTTAEVVDRVDEEVDEQIAAVVAAATAAPLRDADAPVQEFA
jgi:TPP-dependent pyruvate/acetoin dehydrogenase alpha subunit